MNFEAINQNFHGGNATTAYNLLEGRGHMHFLTEQEKELIIEFLK